MRDCEVPSHLNDMKRSVPCLLFSKMNIGTLTVEGSLCEQPEMELFKRKTLTIGQTKTEI